MCWWIRFTRLLRILHKEYFPGGSVVKNLTTNVGDEGDADSILVSERSPGEWNDNQPQYSCLWNPMDRGAWQATVYRVSKSWTGLSDLTTKRCSTVQFSSVAQLCLTLCNPMDCITPGLPVHHQFPEFTQTHVHWVSDAIQSSHPLSSPSPPAFSHSQHQGLFRWVRSSHQVAKVLVFQLQHQSFQWIFRTDLL